MHHSYCKDYPKLKKPKKLQITLKPFIERKEQIQTEAIFIKDQSNPWENPTNCQKAFIKCPDSYEKFRLGEAA